MDTAAADPISAWQEVNTFRCPNGQGRISPEACAELRQRPDWDSSGCAPHEQWMPKQRPPACRRCTEWERLAEEVRARRAAHSSQLIADSSRLTADSEREEGKTVVGSRRSEVGKRKPSKKERMGMGQAIIDCLLCEAEDVPNFSRGLCASCYHKVPKSKRSSYTLEKGQAKREERLAAMQGEEPEDCADRAEESGMTVEPSARRAADIAEMAESSPPISEVPAGLDEQDMLTRMGFERVDINNQQAKVKEAYCLQDGKRLRFNEHAAKESGLHEGSLVEVWGSKDGNLALQVVSRPSRCSLKVGLYHKGKKNGHIGLAIQSKLLVKQGAVVPGTRYEVSASQYGSIVFLTKIEEA